jgi:hypothetical protein
MNNPYNQQQQQFYPQQGGIMNNNIGYTSPNQYNTAYNQQQGYSVPVNSQYTQMNPNANNTYVNNSHVSYHNTANSSAPSDAIPLDAVYLHEKVEFGPEYSQPKAAVKKSDNLDIDSAKLGGRDIKIGTKLRDDETCCHRLCTIL